VRGCHRITALVTALASFAAIAAESPGAYEQEVRPLLDTYCYKCHGAQRPKGGINLSTYTNLISIYRDPRTWQTVLSQLRERNMPPDGKPQPTPEERDRLAAWVEHTLNNLEEGHVPKDPGRVVIHRLSRTEYNNTIRDLLGVETKPADKFPADGGGGGGFDNNADTLFVPPILMERYLEAAAEILDQAKPERIFIAQPGALTSNRSAARRIAGHFAMRAFRRPVEDAEVERLVSVFDAATQHNLAFEDSVKLMLKAVLASPNFLFRIERDRDLDVPYVLDEYELATRLSYFLWSSMPDEELFRLAGEKRLSDPKVLDQQVERMVLDPKAKALADNFAGQWLGVRSLQNAAQPDRRRFANFTSSLRDAMSAEPVEFFQSIVRDNASLLNLIDADYTFVNEELAKHYGIEGIEGAAMRKVKLVDSNRPGGNFRQSAAPASGHGQEPPARRPASEWIEFPAALGTASRQARVRFLS
jgi:mono/diheme cytochrome c family protein